MAHLPQETITTVLNLQQRLLTIINQATRVDFYILEGYGETEATLIVLEELQNARTRAATYYSRFYTLLLRIAESQPTAPTAMLDLLARSINEARATADASEATIQEAIRDWGVL